MPALPLVGYPLGRVFGVCVDATKRRFRAATGFTAATAFAAAFGFGFLLFGRQRLGGGLRSGRSGRGSGCSVCSSRRGSARFGVARRRVHSFAVGFAVGFGLGATDAANRAEFQVSSPTLVTKQGNGFMAGEYSLIAGFGSYAFRGMPVEDKTNTQWVIANYATLGLRIDLESGYGAHRYYSTYEALYLSPGSDLTDEGSDLGGRAAFGLEFPLSDRENLYGKSLTPTLYVQADITLGLGRADKLAGQPDLFNGVGVWVGSRTFF